MLALVGFDAPAVQDAAVIALIARCELTRAGLAF
jgi:hypothetical protein